MLRKLIVIAMGSWAATGVLAADLVQNGSFELPNVNATTTDGLPYYFYILTSGKPSDWSSSGSNVTMFDSRSGAWEAASGSQFVKLESFTSNEVFTNFSTLANQSYKVTFSYAPEPFSTGSQDAVRVLVDGIQQLSVDRASSTLSSLEWSSHSFVFEASGSTSELRFAGSGEIISRGGFIDSVSVTAVPEPSASILFLSGLALVTFVRRRKLV